jgi:hypothetical protein
MLWRQYFWLGGVTMKGQHMYVIALLLAVFSPAIGAADPQQQPVAVSWRVVTPDGKYAAYVVAPTYDRDPNGRIAVEIRWHDLAKPGVVYVTPLGLLTPKTIASPCATEIMLLPPPWGDSHTVAIASDDGAWTFDLDTGARKEMFTGNVLSLAWDGVGNMRASVLLGDQGVDVVENSVATYGEARVLRHFDDPRIRIFWSGGGFGAIAGIYTFLPDGEIPELPWVLAPKNQWGKLDGLPPNSTLDWAWWNPAGISCLLAVRPSGGQRLHMFLYDASAHSVADCSDKFPGVLEGKPFGDGFVLENRAGWVDHEHFLWNSDGPIMVHVPSWSTLRLGGDQSAIWSAYPNQSGRGRLLMVVPVDKGQQIWEPPKLGALELAVTDYMGNIVERLGIPRGAVITPDGTKVVLIKGDHAEVRDLPSAVTQPGK